MILNDLQALTTFRRRRLRLIVRNTTYLLGVNGFSNLARGLYVYALVRYLEPDVYGLVTYGQAWSLIGLSCTALGLGVILSRDVGRFHRPGHPLVTQTLIIRVVTAVGVAILGGLLGWHVETHPMARQLLLIFSVALVGRAIAQWADLVFVAYESTHYTLHQHLIFRSAELLLGCLALAAGYAPIVVVSIHALTWWLQAGYGLVLIRNRFKPPRICLEWGPLARLVAIGAPLGGTVILVNWLPQGPLVLYRYAMGPEDGLGNMAFAMQAFMFLSSVAPIAAKTALPALSRRLAHDTRVDHLFLIRLLGMSSVFGMVAGLVGWLAGPLVVRVAIGPHYEPAGQLLGPILWLLIPWNAGHVLWYLMLAQGRRWMPAAAAALGALALTVAFSPLTASYGSVGAIWATSLGMWIWVAGLLILR